MIKALLIISISFFTSLSVHAQVRCQNLIYSVDSQIDFSYGKVNQTDTYFLERNLITTNKSMLCGPTCAINVITKLKQDYHISNKDNPKIDVEHFVQTVLPNRGRSTDQIVEQGVALEDVKAVLDYKFRKLNIKPEVKIHSVFSFENLSNITLPLLKDGLNNKNAVILLLGAYRGQNLQQNYFPNRFAGHFVVVVGKDLVNPHVLYVQDPNQPDVIKRLHFRPIKPANRLIWTLELQNDDGSPLNGVQVVIDGYVSVK